MKKAKFLKINKREIIAFLVLLFIILVVTGFPYLKNGISGYKPDLMYHLLRVEGVRDSLMQGEYPVRIYSSFFEGYGYGSPLFYPDIFLLVPAFLRIIGFSPVMAWKIFVLIVTMVATITTYYAFRYICKNWKFALCGTTLLMLSQFYLADIQNRIGLSEYLAFIFSPLLIAGIYDFFAKDGKKVYLLGIAFLGLVLSHTIMTFISIVLTLIIFIVMLFVPAEKKYIFCKDKMIALIITAVVTVLLATYYLLPMLEQMLAVEYRYTIPWAQVGEYIQPFSVFFNHTGYFSYIAYVGIGVPIIMIMGCRFFFKKPSNIWADIFYFGGILLLVMMTRVFPWEMFNDTVFNMIQFTYRLYPYALLFLVMGMMMIFSEHYKDDVPHKVIAIILLTAIFFGVWQNYTILAKDFHEVTEATLEQNDYYVGRGEWLPASVNPERNVLKKMKKQQNVVANNFECEFERGYNAGFFETKIDSEMTYEVPLIYYKGYIAYIQTEDDQRIDLPTVESKNGLVKVTNTSGYAGTIIVEYVTTLVQKISLAISCVTLVGVIFWGIKRSTKVWRKERSEI